MRRQEKLGDENDGDSGGGMYADCGRLSSSVARKGRGDLEKDDCKRP